MKTRQMDLLIARDWNSLFNIPDSKIASSAAGDFRGVA